MEEGREMQQCIHTIVERNFQNVSLSKINFQGGLVLTPLKVYSTPSRSRDTNSFLRA
ncbi:hypothetical protein J6590_062554, partial [Homalodisca vitripennis]